MESVTGTYPIATERDAARERFRRERLRETLDNAWKLAPYRSSWLRPPPDDDLAGYFATLPSIEKQWVIDELDGLLVEPHDGVENIVCSTGTSGNRMFRLMTRQEVRLREEFFGAVGRAAGAEQHPRRKLMMRFGPPGHGSVLPQPGRPLVLTSSLNTPWSGDQAIDFLRRTFTVPGVEDRVSTLLVGPWQILQLAAVLHGAGIAPESLAVHTLVVISAPVGRVLRAWVKDWWPGIRLAERYSLSEVFGGATYADACGSFHTDPHTLPEFQPYSLELGASGKGVDLGDQLSELWLTELFPFSQGQPLIRYRTRDLVIREVCSCGRSDSFQFQGRDIGTVLDPTGTRALLTPMAITDAWYEHLLGPAMDPPALHLAAMVPRFGATPAATRPRAWLQREEAWSHADEDGTRRVDGFLDWLRRTATDRGIELDILD